MRTRKITDEQIEQMKALRLQGVKVKEIAERIGCAQSAVSTYTATAKSRSARSGKPKICPGCGKYMEHDANYCSRCGRDIRDERDLLIDGVVTLRSLLIHLPENAIAKADDITRDILNYLKKESE